MTRAAGFLLIAFFWLIQASQADDRLSLEGAFAQGGMAIGRTAPGSVVRFDGQDVRVAPDGTFVIGFHRDDPPVMTLTVALEDGTVLRRDIAVDQRDYEIQRIDGLPDTMVTPPDDVLARIREEAALVQAARDRDTPGTWFAQGFVWPVKGRITGVYGSQRILNGVPRQPHYGVDIAAPEGTPVVAPASGVVSLAHPDMYFSGGTLMIDHGHGLASAFLHMQRISVVEGERVVQGQKIGTVGATGRATGPHLDWRINWFDKRIDPALVAPPFEGG